MKIGQKLILVFLLVSVFAGLAGLISINVSQKALQGYIIDSSIALTVESLDKIDRHIYNRIEDFQAYCSDKLLQEGLVSSNQAFDKLGDLEAYIAKQDQEWVAAPKDSFTPFMLQLINNSISLKIKEQLEFYKRKYGYEVYGEVFVTNKYGANVFQTSKTSDYRQNDEAWWQEAKENGLSVGDVSYDESSGVYSTEIGIRIDDQKGNFIGVMKLILNIREAINIIKSIRMDKQCPSRYFELLSRDGKVLYSGKKGEDVDFLEDISRTVFFKRITGQDGFFTGHSYGSQKGQRLFTYAHSRGYRDFKGFGWILVAEYKIGEIFAPVIRLKSTLLLILIIVTLLAILIGVSFARSISGPIIKLKNATIEIGKGKLGIKLEINRKDEIGILADSFNKMTSDLQKNTISIEKLNQEISGRKIIQEQLREAYIKLKEMQDQLIQAEKLNAVGQLVSGIAHEVRNPLGIILQGIGYLESRLSSKEADISATLATLKDNINRADNIINSLLDFSRVANLGLKAEDINSILETSLSLVKARLKLEGMDIVIETKKDIPRVLADKNKLEQVFINILLNAVQAMPVGGKIIIRTLEKKLEGISFADRRARDNFQAGEKVVIVEIEDTGIGVPEENMKKIFEPFFTTKGQHGVGLGLSVSRDIIHMHRGLIYAESRRGKGTKVSVILKIAETL
jgi:signal transduction histidine kinase